MRLISFTSMPLLLASLFCLPAIVNAESASTAAVPAAATSVTPAEATPAAPAAPAATETPVAAIEEPAMEPIPTPVVVLKGDPIAGKAKSAPCVVCHAEDGNSPIPMYPKIAGQYEAYLVHSLTEYQKGPQGTRNNPIMYGLVGHLSAQDIADLAAYFSAQKQTVGMADPQYLALGEQIYRGGNASVPACLACHGPKGEGNGLANFPRIGGQNAEYIVSQLNAFRSGARGPGANHMMKDVADRMTDEEITAVSSYISGLH